MITPSVSSKAIERTNQTNERTQHLTPAIRLRSIPCLIVLSILGFINQLFGSRSFEFENEEIDSLNE